MYFACTLCDFYLEYYQENAVQFEINNYLEHGQLLSMTRMK